MIILLLFLIICLMYPDFARGVWEGLWGDE